MWGCVVGPLAIILETLSYVFSGSHLFDHIFSIPIGLAIDNIKFYKYINQTFYLVGHG